MTLSGGHCVDSPKWGTVAHGPGESRPAHLLEEKTAAMVQDILENVEGSLLPEVPISLTDKFNLV